MIEIDPLKKSLRTSISLPTSKSLNNRALVCAAMANGKSVLTDFSFCEDTEVMIESLKRLGLNIEIDTNTVTIDGGLDSLSGAELYFANSGTTARFLTALASLLPEPSNLDGDKRMRERPQKDLLDALRSLGAEIESKDNRFPFSIKSGHIGFKRELNLKADISSQYLSALLMIAPYLPEGLKINIDGELVSAPYVQMTISVMRDFAVNVSCENNYFQIENQEYKSCHYVCEGDASAATYFRAIEFLGNNEIELTNLKANSLQADIAFSEALNKLKNSSGDIEIDMNKMPDSVPSLAICAASLAKKTTITNIANLRLKECDRIKALALELRKLGVETKELDAALIVSGGKLHGAEIETYNDHRMAMSFAALGTKIPGIRIKNPSCVKKSYPDFWKDLEKIGIKFITISG